MQRLNDVIENMLRETVARRDTVAPGWRDEIRAIVRNMIEEERKECADLVDIIRDDWVHADMNIKACAADYVASAIRKRSNVELTGSPASGESELNAGLCRF